MTGTDDAESKNAADIRSLTAVVDKVVMSQQYQAERATEDRAAFKDMLKEMREINEKVGTIADLQKDVVRLNGDIGKVRHDLRSTDQAVQALPLLKDKLDQVTKEVIEERGRVNAIKEWKDKYNLGEMQGRLQALEADKLQYNVAGMDGRLNTLEADKLKKDGATNLVKTVWGLFGFAIVGFLAWAAVQFVDSRQTVYRYESRGVVSGE